MSSYEMYCSVCKGSFPDPVQWKAHLPQLDHQRKARLACRRWNTATKRCVLVAFGSRPVVECDLIQRLSCGIRTIVTDFVWWKKRPLVGLVQFESRAKAEEVMQRTKSELGISDGNRVQLKRACDYLELEWNVLLSLSKTDNTKSKEDGYDEFEESLVKCEDGFSRMDEDEKLIELGNLTGPPRGDYFYQSNEATVDCHVLDEEPTESQEEAYEKTRPIQSGNAEAHELIILSSTDSDEELQETQDNSRYPEVSPVFMKRYAHLFRTRIAIPRYRYNACIKVINLIESKFRETIPWVKIVPFRHWYLGITNCGTNELILYVDFRHTWDPNEPFVEIDTPDIVNDFFTAPEKVIPEIVLASNAENDERFGRAFFHEPTATKFRLVKNLNFIPEVQTCTLLKLLSQTSLYVLPLIGLVNYWAKENDYEFGQLITRRGKYRPTNPAPASLDWLVIFFLVNRKEIPAPFQILNRPHKDIQVNVKAQKIEVGFSEDISCFRRRLNGSTFEAQLDQIFDDSSEFYGPKFVRHCILLLQKFFEFYGTMTGEANLEFNLKDGLMVQTQLQLPNQKPKTSLTHPLDKRFRMGFCEKSFSSFFIPEMRKMEDRMKRLWETMHTTDKSRDFWYGFMSNGFLRPCRDAGTGGESVQEVSNILQPKTRKRKLKKTNEGKKVKNGLASKGKSKSKKK